MSLLPGSAAQRDPVTNFCRRFGHQTAVVDKRLYIDGGLVDWNPITSYPQNYTSEYIWETAHASRARSNLLRSGAGGHERNMEQHLCGEPSCCCFRRVAGRLANMRTLDTWLSYHDLSTVADSGMPPLYANLSKNASIPNVNGGALWADEVNKRLYLFGGEFYQEPPTALNLFGYDILANQWDNFGAPRTTTPISGISYGAGVSISNRGEGYYYGGWMSNASVPGWGSGPPVATANMVKYTMNDNSWVNSTGPDSTRRAEGVLLHIPAGDGGMLVYFGGVKDLFGNGTITPQPMDQIFLYDVLSNKWYIQNATGVVPEVRRRFCAGVTWAPDQSSYNM